MTPSASILLFDDARARAWEPMALTRPVGDLLFGALRMWERAEHVFGAPAGPFLAGDALAGFHEPGGPTAVRHGEVSGEGVRVLLLSRAVPDGPLPDGWDRRAGTLRMGDVVVGWVVPPGAPLPPEEHLLDPGSAPGDGASVPLTGLVLDNPWDLLEHNPARIDADLRHVLPPPEDPTPIPEGVYVLGDHPVHLCPRVEVEPGVVFDTREGPVRLESGVRVRAFTRLQGPLWIGPGSILQGGTFAQVSAGRRCRLRGEIDASVIQGFSNKAHDGYLGHALVGSWVNLGAMTTNSDLKNNYGNVRMTLASGSTDTGVMKLGCFLGDHVKTGIGTLLNTGTLVGAGSNLFGGAMPPTRVPAFSWGSGSRLTTHRLDPMLKTAERAMGRRDIPLTDAMRGVLSQAFHATEGERNAGEPDLPEGTGRE